MNKEEIEDQEIREVREAIGIAARTLEDVIAESRPSNMVEVKDHYICYGSALPLCGQELGGKGLIKDKKYITCPECLSKLKK